MLTPESGRIGRPDFIIGGAPRSGTTWLYCLLDRHPDVFMAKPVAPEPKFFLADETYERGIDYYFSTWFSGVGPGKIAGEKSSNYLESATAARRIHEHLPEVKLIFILREPVDRAFSNYLWSRQNGHEKEDFATALDLEEQRERDVSLKFRFARPHAYFSRGLYADFLRPYFSLFAADQILCLRFEDIKTNAAALAKRVHEFLGIPPRPDDARPLGVINSSRRDDLAIPMDLRAQLQRRYTEPNFRLAALLGPDFELWGS